MQRSKSFALLVVLAAFVAGVALGYTGDRILSRGDHGRRDRSSRERIARELDLTPAQRAQFDSIMSLRRTQMRELYKPVRPQLDSLQRVSKALMDSTHEQLKRVLTPAQAKKLDELRERGRKRSAQARAHHDRDRKDSPTPTP
ncbi:MAG TPA: Spy/CpxP family protein refolding chaperone [Gemmatimonadaceae bacterium]|nr:Spy/CpxP family protein refolding chaperone [Gemmatimonadaceae bacterium]